MTNIAMEDDPFIDGSPIKNCDFPWRTVSHNQMVYIYIYINIYIYNMYPWLGHGAFPSGLQGDTLISLRSSVRYRLRPCGPNLRVDGEWNSPRENEKMMIDQW